MEPTKTSEESSSKKATATDTEYTPPVSKAEKAQNNSKEPKKEKTSQVVSYQYEGPLPHPSILRGYEEIVPGSAKDMIEAFKTQNAHRIKMEEKKVFSIQFEIIASRIFAFVFALLVLALAFYCIYTGKTGTAIFVFLSETLGIVYVYHRNKESETQPSNKPKNP